ncbi:MAG: carbon-nitrogen hydrolase family protein [Planctomycetes bacterium]|nr:carbon-nitrogen hydrolase family protein [Planctomycetota bacterium]
MPVTHQNFVPPASPAPPPFQAAAVQMDVKIGEKEQNLTQMAGFARRAAGAGARLVVFPECALTGYCFESRQEAMEHAEPLPGPATARMAGLGRELGAHIVFGLVERAGDRLFNALALVGPEGFIAGYRKAHLPCLGLDQFVSPGDQPFAVHDLRLCRLGMNICYDGGFPESARVMALLGAELIVLPTNWPKGAEEFALYGVNTRGLENVVYYLAANRVGEERGFRFIGLSRIVDVHGRTLAEADGGSETILLAPIDPAVARVKKIIRVPGKHSIDRFADRRPEFYGPIADPRLSKC